MASKPFSNHDDREGLQVALPDNAPEVFHAQAGLLYSQSTHHGKHKESYAYEQYRVDSYQEGEQELEPVRSKPVCGIKRRTAILLCVFALLVVIAVVLAATLSTVLNNGSSPPDSASASSAEKDGPLPVQKDTGIAVIAATSQGQAYGYYQDENNDIIEAEINDETWEFPDGTTAQDNVVTSNASPGSPLAALSWIFDDVEYRLLFFIDSDSRLSATNRTASGLWSSPKVILSDSDAALASGTIALDAYVVPDFKKGTDALRVYYGSVSNGIREVGWGFLTENPGYYWPGDASNPFLYNGDVSTGIGVTSSTDKSLNIYLRNSSTGCVTQWNFGYGTLNGHFWEVVAAADASDIDSGSDITACSDGKTGIDYIFYQNQSGKITMRTSQTAPTDSIALQNHHVLEESAAYKSKLRAKCDEATSSSGPVLYYQASDLMTQLSYLRVTIDGSIAARGVV